MPVVVEICVSSVTSALAAEEGGASRVELCENLAEEGTTPSAGTIALACRRLRIPTHVIIRPRGGDFCYSDVEFEVMKHDVGVAKSLGVAGVVIGLLNRDETVDRERTAALVELARPLSVTFHRAFDMTPDPSGALDVLIGLRIDRVLTSGQRRSALEGQDLIAELVRQAAGRLHVMAGAGITAENALPIIRATGVHEIHVGSSASVEVSSHDPQFPSDDRPPRVYEYRHSQADAERVWEVVRAVRPD
jgi:copper homeostasis protein